MKNFFKSLMLVAVAAMAFTACQNDVDDVNAVSKGTTLTFTANLDTETRVAFGDADAEGIRKVTWEKGDLVSFIVYDDFNNIYDYVNDVEVKADGAIAAFTVAFEKTIQTNYTIKAYVGKYVVNVGQEYNYGYDYYLVYDRGNSFTNQYPTDAGLTDVYLSAEVPYLGDDNVTITFGHDYAYGKMTVDYPVDFEKIEVEFYNANYSYVYATIYGDDVKGKVFWFYCKEISDVNRVAITAYDAEDNEYVLSKDVDAAKNFRFEKGLISSFSVKDFVQKLSNPEVTGEIVDNKAVFTWTAVEHATSYDVYVNDELVKEAYTGTSYEVSLDGYTPFSDVTITVEVNPEDGYIAPESGADASVVVPITKDAKGTHELVFDVCSPVENFNNTYKFTQSTEMEGYSVDNFMYLRFNEAIITSGSALYNHDHLKRTTSGWNTVYSDSCFWMAEALRPAGSYGYSDTYNPYNYKSEVFTIYPNYGDACAIYVDVEGDTYTFTVFVKNNGFFGSENLFKGTWSGKLGAEETLATPTNLSATVQDGDVVVNWASVAKAEAYKVTLGNETKTVNTTTATFENAPAGEWTISVVATAKGYKDSEAATTTVTVEAIVAQFTSATAVAADANNNFHYVTFTNGKDTAVVKIATRGTTEYKAGHYDQEGDFSNEDYLLLGGYATDNTWNGVNCWPVTMDVVDNGDGTATFTISAREYSGNYSQHTGTYTGKINGLTLYGNEPTIPNYVFTSAKLQWHSDNWTGINVDLFTNTGDKLHLNFDGCTTANFIPVKEYQIAGTVPAIYTYSYSKVTFAGVEYCLEGGSVIVEEVEGKYRFTMNEVSYGYYNSYTYEYSNLAKFNGSFVGEIEGLILPSEYVAPEPDVVPEFVIPGEGVSYDLDWRYTKLVAGIEPGSNSIKVAQDNGLDWTINFNSDLTSIVAGNYKAVQNFSSATALEVDTYLGGIAYEHGSWFYADEFDNVSINVQKNGDFYCITLIGSGGYDCPVSGKYRLVYIGKIQ